ncbi:MAG: AEC family transporter [Roseburia sp.]|nr:AEC family transporter [Roseburia sp.]
MDIGVIFGQMLVLFAMMMVGYFAYKGGWLDDASTGRISKLVVNVFNPILVVNGVLGQSSQYGGNKVLHNMVFVLFYFVLIVFISVLIPIILHVGKQRKSLYQVMSVFGNIGFMGIPVIKSIFGDEAIIYVAFYILVYNLMLYTYGVFLARRAAKERAKWQKDGADGFKDASGETKSNGGFLKRVINPGVVAALIAVVIFVTGLSVPESVNTFCDYMGNTTIPLSMILIGVSVAQADLKTVFSEWRIYAFILLRMVLLPIVMAWLLQSFLLPGIAVDPVVFGVFILELGMPVGSIIALIVREQGADADFCTKGVVLSTLASIVTIPIICAFL